MTADKGERREVADFGQALAVRQNLALSSLEIDMKTGFKSREDAGSSETYFDHLNPTADNSAMY